LRTLDEYCAGFDDQKGFKKSFNLEAMGAGQSQETNLQAR
jgi:hypothetical protein